MQTTNNIASPYTTHTYIGVSIVSVVINCDKLWSNFLIIVDWSLCPQALYLRGIFQINHLQYSFLHHKKQLWSTHIKITIYFPLKPSLTAMTLRGPIEKMFQRSGPKLRKTRARMTRTSWSPTCRRWLQTVKITVLLSWLYRLPKPGEGKKLLLLWEYTAMAPALPLYC